MPAPTYNLGNKTRRSEWEQAFLSDKLQTISYARPAAKIEYRGQTLNNTPTEIFINGKGTISGVTDSANRLYFPETGIAYFQGFYTGLNVTDNVVSMAGSFRVSAHRADGGNISLSATATGTAVAPNVLGGNPQYTVDVGNVAAVPIAFTANTTFQSLVCTVTGIASKQIEWLVQLEPVFTICAGRFSAAFFGDAGRGDSLEP